MQYIFGIIIFLFGSILGSFIAVIGSRYNTGLSFLKGRSICFSCNTELKKKDLIPIFSFLFLKGRCRYCASKIPKETVIIEVLMGFLSVLAFLKLGLSLNLILLVVIFAVVLLISVYDLKHFIIPDSFLVAFFVLSFLYNILFTFHLSSFYLLFKFGILGVIIVIPFFLIFLVSKGTWFGFGDVKYIAVLGFFLGFAQGLSAVILAFWIGAVCSLLALCLKKIAPHINLPLFKNNLTIKSEIPFGPFLSLGIIISFYFGADLLKIHELFNFF